jgi:hypothetical protein
VRYYSFTNVIADELKILQPFFVNSFLQQICYFLFLVASFSLQMITALSNITWILPSCINTTNEISRFSELWVLHSMQSIYSYSNAITILTPALYNRIQQASLQPYSRLLSSLLSHSNWNSKVTTLIPDDLNLSRWDQELRYCDLSIVTRYGTCQQKEPSAATQLPVNNT